MRPPCPGVGHFSDGKLGQISNGIYSLTQVILSLGLGKQLVSSSGRVERPQPGTQIHGKTEQHCYWATTN